MSVSDRLQLKKRDIIGMQNDELEDITQADILDIDALTILSLNYQIHTSLLPISKETMYQYTKDH